MAFIIITEAVITETKEKFWCLNCCGRVFCNIFFISFYSFPDSYIWKDMEEVTLTMVSQANIGKLEDNQPINHQRELYF